MRTDIIALLIPIIAIVMGIGTGIITLYLNYRKRREMFALYHQERMAAIEKGIELPPLPDEFFSDNCKPRSPHGRLLTGLIWSFIGLSWMIAFYLKPTRGMDGAAIYGLIPATIGLAYLVYYFAVGKKEAEQLEAERKARLVGTNRPPTI
jgi:hypothetical protein